LTLRKPFAKGIYCNCNTLSILLIEDFSNANSHIIFKYSIIQMVVSNKTVSELDRTITRMAPTTITNTNHQLKCSTTTI